MAAGQILEALEISALRNHEVSLWFVSPMGEATLLRTHMTCCAKVMSLLSKALAQWSKSFSMHAPSRLPRHPLSAPERGLLLLFGGVVLLKSTVVGF